MNPVIQRLQNTLFAGQSLGIDDPNPLNWTFSKRVKSLGPEFYRKIVPSHIILNMEYSLLGQQIRANLLLAHPVNKEQLVSQLVAALLLAELLEQVYQNYLIVPREVARLRAQQQIYRDLLLEIKGAAPKHVPNKHPVDVGLSFSQQLRLQTLNINLYRLLFVRTKRVLDLVSALNFSADWYRHIIGNLDKYTDPFLPHIAWFFYVPRLTTNLFLLFKHLLPGLRMDKKEKDLGWWVRFQGQMLRRWFELGNDIAWVGLGIANCFILTGALAPIGVYLTIAFFAYDVLLSVIRTYIELNRLFVLRQQYQDALVAKPKNKEEIEQHLEALDKQISFEMLRLGAHGMTTSLIFLAGCCAAPLFATSPIIPLIGAIALVLVCFINFALVPILNHYRPRDMIEVPSEGIKKLGFFAKKNEPKTELMHSCDESQDECPNSTVPSLL